jgi:hypothetical protein
MLVIIWDVSTKISPRFGMTAIPLLNKAVVTSKCRAVVVTLALRFVSQKADDRPYLGFYTPRHIIEEGLATVRSVGNCIDLICDIVIRYFVNP